MTETDQTAALASLLTAVASGNLSPEQAMGEATALIEAAAAKASTQPRAAAVQLEHTTVDLDRAQRTGSAEVIFGQNKTSAQIVDIARTLLDAGQRVLATRLDGSKLAALETQFPNAELHAVANLATINPPSTSAATVVERPQNSGTGICVISAGTSDQNVAEEAALTAEFYGSKVQRVRDVGVAGIHRLFARLDEINQARVVVVVAGMEGALPSVLGGLISKPMIAVPTSVGYGAAFGGLAALLGMLNACATGISVVNIDNGFGAGVLAHRINQL